MKKLFLCDIDGTIIDGSRNMNEISEKTKYAIRELSKDNDVFIASGRCKGLLDKQILSLPVNGYILCNGAYAEINGKEIYSEYFSNEIVEKIVNISLSNNGFYVLESLNNMYVNDLNAPQFINFLNGWGTPLRGFSSKKVIDDKFHIAMVGFSKEEDCINCEKQLSEYTSIIRHHNFMSYDVNIKGIDKGYAAKCLMEYLDISQENAYCFGDGVNDLEMLLAVGHPVKMANCASDLNKYDFENTDDVLDDGFYWYLVRNNLIKAI